MKERCFTRLTLKDVKRQAKNHVSPSPGKNVVEEEMGPSTPFFGKGKAGQIEGGREGETFAKVLKSFGRGRTG